jgi:hypothetical protein
VETDNPADDERINDVIRSADPEPVQVNRSAADSRSWNNGEIPVK